MIRRELDEFAAWAYKITLWNYHHINGEFNDHELTVFYKFLFTDVKEVKQCIINDRIYNEVTFEDGSRHYYVNPPEELNEVAFSEEELKNIEYYNFFAF